MATPASLLHPHGAAPIHTAAPPATGSARLAPFNPTTDQAIAEVVGTIHLTASSVFVDIGSGDGRVVLAAAAATGCTGIGIEMDEKLHKRAVLNLFDKLKEEVFAAHRAAVEAALDTKTELLKGPSPSPHIEIYNSKTMFSSDSRLLDLIKPQVGRDASRVAEAPGHPRALACSAALTNPELQLTSSTDESSSRLSSARVCFVRGDATKLRVHAATHVFIYLVPDGIEIIKPLLHDHLEHKATIVAYTFSVRGWTPTLTYRVRGMPVYVYAGPECVPHT